MVLSVTRHVTMVSYSIDVLGSELIALFPLKLKVLGLTSKVLKGWKFACEFTSLPQLQSIEELKLEPS